MFERLGVSSHTLGSHPNLRQRVVEAYPGAKFWDGPRIAKHGRAEEDKLIGFLEQCDAAIVGFEPINDRVLSALPQLKTIAKFGAGCETIDFNALQKHAVRFGYTFGVNKLAVAELALTFMISGLRFISAQNLAMRAGKRPGFRNGRLLTNRVVGIHGCGNIGKEIVRLLKPFGCTLIACDIKDYAEFYRANGVTPVSFEELLARSEILTLHLPRTKATLGLYSRAVLARLRPDCLLINTCRGEIVDEDALLDVLDKGAIAAACFDVFAIEPAECDRLLAQPNFLATPHIGASTEETRIMMVDAAIAGLTTNALVDPALYYDN
jgi:phosphoglycerate dehydrogenase-like enzyme